MNPIKQTTSHILMIKPVAFDFNAETAVNNAFQQTGGNANAQQRAEIEFDGFVEALTAAGVDVTVVRDTPVPHTPDSIFPNNWISFHQDGALILYPMYAANRRAERKAHVVAAIASKFEIDRCIDFSGEEAGGRFLEGTGSMVLDRANAVAYACLSPRTDERLFHEWCERIGFTGISFRSVDAQGGEIYHTNVMMCVADRYAVICSESIRDSEERRAVLEQLTKNGKHLVEIGYDQMNRFAGNMLQVENASGQTLLVMSSQAYAALTAEQIKTLEAFNPILHADLTAIETNGGGSARCMMAEVFLPSKQR
jgi:hypothetical protein